MRLYFKYCWQPFHSNLKLCCLLARYVAGRGGTFIPEEVVGNSLTKLFCRHAFSCVYRYLYLPFLCTRGHKWKIQDRGGGFIGHQSKGNQTEILAGIEIKLTTRICTGLTFMVVIPNFTRTVIQAEIHRHKAVGGLVWTDGHKSHKWMGKEIGRGELSAVSGFRWDWVNHSNGEFSRP
jgi:hypothetical protein